ncbi:hypothetical protein QBC40DRAFT_294050 [Triangularia verruculosa]|uniref:Uncharacterized protein n=1 Tax=Triangularia verruculosa TaxID=2587418 RepID=A0AAN6XMM6_9PEZI|nr:hypothetical protein QBC40DRAFT_294050 [Triangularia verruculosa]
MGHPPPISYERLRDLDYYRELEAFQREIEERQDEIAADEQAQRRREEREERELRHLARQLLGEQRRHAQQQQELHTTQQHDHRRAITNAGTPVRPFDVNLHIDQQDEQFDLRSSMGMPTVRSGDTARAGPSTDRQLLSIEELARLARPRYISGVQLYPEPNLDDPHRLLTDVYRLPSNRTWETTFRIPDPAVEARLAQLLMERFVRNMLRRFNQAGANAVVEQAQDDEDQDNA